MSKRCVFTIVAKNYIGLAQLLQKSIMSTNSEVDFFIVVADEFEDSNYPDNIIVAKDSLGISSELWVEMTFKYNLTEFCTSIKPFAFKILFNKGYEKVIYMDPDIYVFNSLEPIFFSLEKAMIIMTPHVAGMHINYEGEHDESLILWEGSYNLGFCALAKKDKVMTMLDWWGNKLIDQCFAYKGYPYCYDQKWMVLLNCYFNQNEILISRNLGYNLAPWNYFEREVYVDEGTYRVRYRGNACNEESYPVTFVHFAGYKYADLIKGEVKRVRLNIANYPDIDELVKIYIKEFQRNADCMNKYLPLSYSYGFYEDGTPIEKIHRNIYNGLRKKGYNIGNPFSSRQYSLLHYIKMENLITGSETERLNMTNYKGLSNKEKKLDMYYRIIKKLIGFKRYLLFQKSLHIYVNPEKQSLLLDKYYKD